MTPGSPTDVSPVSSAYAVAPGVDSGRVFWIDLARAFAMVAIVFCHCDLGEFGEDQACLIGSFIGSAVLFFMCSGALIFPLRMPARTFYRRRFVSYVPQWIIWSLVYLWLAEHLGGLSHDYAVRELKWIFFAPTFGAGWFLYALTGLYLIAPVISPWIAGASRRQLEWFLLAWAVSGLTPLAQVHIPLDLTNTPVAPFFGFMGYMVAGHYLARFPVAARPRRQQLLLWGVLVAVGILYTLRMFVTARRWGFTDILSNDLSINVMAINMLWFALCSLVTGAPRWLKAPITLVSTCSLGIYLWHLVLYKYVWPVGSMPLGRRFVITLIVSTALAWAGRKLYYYIVKKISTLKHH